MSGAIPQPVSRLSMPSLRTPGLTMPLRSLLMSLRKTGTPMSEKLSASTFRDTVFPVPVAPAIRPCRLAMEGSRYTGPPAPVPTHILLSCSMSGPPFPLQMVLRVFYTFCPFPVKVSGALNVLIVLFFGPSGAYAPSRLIFAMIFAISRAAIARWLTSFFSFSFISA